jgi:nitroimidazol reductase NimA-like FMN-containing flavoprotein (pyridoxamine 5'-phosphate oxidase superfamily)
MRYHLRRRDREITENEEIINVLKWTKYMAIAMVKNNQTYLVSLIHG